MTRHITSIALGAVSWFGIGSAAVAQSGGVAITLTGQETPALQPWTKPASISWVDSSDDAEDRFTVEGALKASRVVFVSDASLGMPQLETAVFGRLVASVNDQDAVSKRKSTYKGQLGFQFDWWSGGAIIPGSQDEQGRGGAAENNWTVYTDAYVSYDEATTFGDPTTPACVADPTLAACGDQEQTSYRLVLDVLPHHRRWSGGPYVSGAEENPAITGLGYDFSPRLTLFHDQIIDAVLNDAGEKIDGEVSGARLMVAGSVTPPIFDYRVVLRASYQHTWAYSRSAAREPVFGASTGLFAASIDYEFGPRFWEAKGRWSPSIGISYTSGEDPLEGRKDRDDTTSMLRLTYAN